MGPRRVAVRKAAEEEEKREMEKEKESEKKKRETCLVQKPFNNFLWKLKEEIVLGWIAGGVKPI